MGLSNKNKVVEFVGLPGAGKSFVCQKLYSDENVQNHLVLPQPVDSKSSLTRNWEKLTKAGCFVLTNISLALEIHKFSGSCQIPGNRLRHRKCINLYAELWHMNKVEHRRASAKLRPNSAPPHPAPIPTIHLNEQGVLQGIWSICLYADNGMATKLVHKLEPWLPASIVQVKVEDARTHEQLLQSRSTVNSRFDAMNKDALHDAMQMGSDTLDEIIQAWTEINPLHKPLIYLNKATKPASSAKTPAITSLSNLGSILLNLQQV